MKKKAYISVNKHIISKNSRTGTKDPAISVRVGKYGKPTYVKKLKINGPSELIYDPAKPILHCGARLVLVTDPENVEV